MQKHALDNFKRVGVDVRTGVRVTEVRRTDGLPPWQLQPLAGQRDAR